MLLLLSYMVAAAMLGVAVATTRAMLLSPSGMCTLLAVAFVPSGMNAVPRWTYGGEANETIRFMEELPEALPEELSETAAIWLQQLGGGGGGSGTRGRTGSDGAEQRPPGRPLLRLPRARHLRSSSAVRCREAWRRGEARRRWRVGEHEPARGEADR